MEFILSGNINYWAVLAITALSIVLGFAWYGPLFGKTWMQEAGWTPEKMAANQTRSMVPTYILMTIGSLITALILAIFINYTDATTVQEGLSTGFYLWLGFLAPVQMGAVLWEMKSWRYFAINTSYNLVHLLISGVILALY